MDPTLPETAPDRIPAPTAGAAHPADAVTEAGASESPVAPPEFVIPLGPPVRRRRRWRSVVVPIALFLVAIMAGSGGLVNRLGLGGRGWRRRCDLLRWRGGTGSRRPEVGGTSG